MPLRDGKDALRVNWFEIEIVNARGETTYRNSCVTDLPVATDPVAELAACIKLAACIIRSTDAA